MSQPKRHHYIPRFFFEPWHCDDNKNVWVYERKDGKVPKPYRQSTKSICCENNLYTMSDKIKQESRTDLETKFLSKIDNHAAKILKKIIDKACSIDNIKEEEKEKLSKFLISIPTRTPEQFRETIEQSSYTFRHNLQRNLPKNEDSMILISGHEKYGIIDNIGYEIYQKIIQDPEHIKRFMNMKWFIINIPDICRNLVTSDRPMICHNTYKSEKFTFSISISPRNILFATECSNIYDKIIKMNKDKILEEHNKLTIRQANTKAFCRDNTSHSDNFFRNNLSIHPNR